MKSTTMKTRSRDSYENSWRDLEPALAHLYIEQVNTSALDALKGTLPSHLGAKSINNRLALVKAVLTFVWKRERLANVPHVPMESVPKKVADWYSVAERDRFLRGMMKLRPDWYLFFYLTMRLGLRLGEVYAIAHRQIQHIPPALLVDQAVQRGTKIRPATLVSRKNNEAYNVSLCGDIMDAIRWHKGAGYGGMEYLFTKDGHFRRYMDSHRKPMWRVQTKMGLRRLSHNQLGRHSVASQAVTSGVPMKAIQSQLGHRCAQSTQVYAHLGEPARLRLVEDLTPSAPPHETARVNVGSTATSEEIPLQKQKGRNS